MLQGRSLTRVGWLFTNRSTATQPKQSNERRSRAPIKPPTPWHNFCAVPDEPRRLDITVSELRLAFVHGSLSAISRFVFASTPSRVKALDLVLSGADGIIGGHCGLPFTQV